MAVRHLDPPGDRRDAIIFARDLAAAEPILRLRLRMTPLVRLLRNGMTRRIRYDRDPSPASRDRDLLIAILQLFANC